MVNNNQINTALFMTENALLALSGTKTKKVRVHYNFGQNAPQKVQN